MDEGVIPRFYLKEEERADGSTFTREYVEITIVGDRNSVPVAPVNQGHIDRWPDKYAAFKAGVEGAETGHRLEKYPDLLTPRQIVSLNAYNIYTLEHLAAVSDDHVGHIGIGGRTMREKARKILEEGKPGIDELKAENDALKAQMAEMMERMAALEENQKRGPGRPKKEAA